MPAVSVRELPLGSDAVTPISALTFLPFLRAALAWRKALFLIFRCNFTGTLGAPEAGRRSSIGPGQPGRWLPPAQTADALAF